MWMFFWATPLIRCLTWNYTASSRIHSFLFPPELWLPHCCFGGLSKRNLPSKKPICLAYWVMQRVVSLTSFPATACSCCGPLRTNDSHGTLYPFSIHFFSLGLITAVVLAIYSRKKRWGRVALGWVG